MELNLIAVAVPIFFAMIGLEAIVAWWLGRTDTYRFDDAITDLSCGVTSEALGVFAKVLMLSLYTLVWSSMSLGLLEGGWAWLAAFVGVDFVYYWWHRAGHRVNFIWAAHIVHHHSEDYNLAVALRQALFTKFSSGLFYLPLAVLGVHPVIFATCAALNTLYQFWIHTRLIDRLGPLEWVMNTPSHHRVHHGVNPEYIDKNYAGVFIVWDRLFGTFVEEAEEPVYGTVTVIQSWNPVWANLHYWVYMARIAATTPRLADKIWVWFAPPEWSPDGPKVVPEVSTATHTKWDTPYAHALVGYVTGQFVMVAAAVLWMLLVEESEPWMHLAAVGLLVLWATWSWGMLFEQRSWAYRAEYLRLALLPALTSAIFWGTASMPGLLWTTGAFSALSAGYLWMATGAAPEEDRQ